MPGNLWVDFGVLILSSIIGVAMASGLLLRLAR